MKRLLFELIAPLSLTLLLAAPVAVAKEDKPAGPFQASQEDPLQKLMKVPEIKERLDACRKAGVSASGLDKCLWDGDDNQVPAMDATLKKQISTYLKTANKEGQPAGKTLKETASVVEHFQEKKDPAIQKLEAYLSLRMRQALYGEVNNDLAKEVGKVAQNAEKKYSAVDHKVFYDLYNNQISQNMVSTISSYCIEASAEALYTIPPDADGKKKRREANLKLLRGLDDVEKKNAQEKKLPITGSAHWNTCLETISKVCYAESEEAYCAQNSVCATNYKYSKDRACAVNRSIRGARQAILANNEIKEHFQKTVTASPTLEHDNEDLKVSFYDPTDEKRSIQRISLFSSGEIYNKNNEYTAEVKARLERFKACYDESRPDGQKVLDEKACEEFITDDREEQEELLAEMSMRTRAVSQQLSDLDEKGVEEFLKKEGHSDEEIEHLVEKTNLEELKAEINNRYEAERQALIEQMAEQIENKTVEEDTPLKGTAVEGKLATIRQELESQEENFKQLVHYNNIVSGFLTVTPEGKDAGESFSNTEAIMTELAHSAYNPEEAPAPAADAQQRTPSSGIAADYFERLNKNLEPVIANAESRPKKAGESSLVFGIQDINSILLRYNNSKGKESKAE